MINHPNIDLYIDWVEKNPDKTDKYIKQLIQNIVRPTLSNEKVFFDVDTYEKCIRYCEAHYWSLIAYQKFCYAFVFMYIDDAPVFSRFVIEMGRGNGKTSGFMPLIDFLTTEMYGVKNYHCDIVANNEDQAKKDFNIVWEKLEDNKSKWRKKYDWTREIIKNKTTRAEIRYNTSNARTKDGKESGCVLFDEVHAFETFDQINVFTSQLGKIKHPRVFFLTTQGFVREGAMDELIGLCKQILKTGENDVGYFPMLYELDDVKEVDSPDMWIKANPSIERMPVLKKQIMDDYKESKRLPSKWPEFMTKRMNMPARDEAVVVCSWEDILSACYSDPVMKTERSCPDLTRASCVIGIDYADIRDFASAGLLFKIDGEYIWRQHTWICCNSPFFKDIKFPFSNFGQNGFNDYEIVDEKSLSAAAIVYWCLEQMKKYNVQKIVMDTYRFSLFREAFEQNNIPIESRSNPYGVVRMIRHVGSIDALTAPVIEEAFVNHKINYGDSAIMRWYTNNTSITMDKNGNKSYGKISAKLRKNDGFMAFVVAMSCRNLLETQIIYV